MTNAERINLRGDARDGRLTADVGSYGMVTLYRVTGETVWTAYAGTADIAADTDLDALVALLAACV